MFEFVKAKKIPEGPHEFGAEIEIERPASEVYPLIDLADQRHEKRQLGDSIEPLPGKPGTWVMVVKELPDARFVMTETEAERDVAYGFSCVSEPLFGRAARSHEHYRIEALGKDRCRVVLTNTVEFQRRLREQEYAEEALMMSLAGYNALAKLKMLAEEGAEAVLAEAESVVFGVDDEVWTCSEPGTTRH